MQAVTTLWVLLTIIGTSLPVQTFDVYPTQAACQAQIDKLPPDQQRTIAGARFACMPVAVHDAQ